MDWYESIIGDAVVRVDGRIDRVLVYRDIERALDHAPDLAGPWALMVQYLLPFDAPTAFEIWREFGSRFLVEGTRGVWAEVAPGSGVEDVRATCLATWLAREIGDDRRHEALLAWVEETYEPRFDADTGEFAYWFDLDEPYPRGQWNNAVMNLYVAPPGTWTALLEDPALNPPNRPGA